MHKHKPITSIAAAAAFTFCLTVFPGCTSKELNRTSNACDPNDNNCCTCVATYTQVGQVAATQQVCTPAEKQNFITTWTNPLVSIECKR